MNRTHWPPLNYFGNLKTFCIFIQDNLREFYFNTMKKFISILEVLVIITFVFYTFLTNDEPTDKVFFFLLECSAVSIWHLYDKYKNSSK